MTAQAPPARGPRTVRPFTIFGIAAAVAAGGAVWEISYYAGNAALSPNVLGTTIGIVLALVAFFVWGLRAQPNE